MPGKEGLSTAEREALARLRRQVKQLQTERGILAKATARFADSIGFSRCVMGGGYDLCSRLVGFIYLAVVLDGRSRRLVGWSIGEQMDADLVH